MKAIIEGVFMGASPKSRTRDGQIETSVAVDIYQGDSPAQNKMVTVKVADGANLAAINEKYKLGAPIKCTASVSAFNGNLYPTHIDGIVKAF